MTIHRDPGFLDIQGSCSAVRTVPSTKWAWELWKFWKPRSFDVWSQGTSQPLRPQQTFFQGLQFLQGSRAYELSRNPRISGTQDELRFPGFLGIQGSCPAVYEDPDRKTGAGALEALETQENESVGLRDGSALETPQFFSRASSLPRVPAPQNSSGVLGFPRSHWYLPACQSSPS